ncbi:gag/pol polyprotein [Tanacetum coccineum]
MDPSLFIYSAVETTFVHSDLGPLNYFLGIEIVPHVPVILLSQKKYILELLQSAGLSNCNPVPSPMVTSDLRPRYVNICILQSGIIGLQLNGFYVIFMVRLNMAGDSDDRRSMGGFAIYLGSNKPYILDHNVKQLRIFTSSTEAKYKALADIVAELTWLQALLHELGIRSSLTPILWCDNLGATYLSANPFFRARTKHVEIDYHFVREKVAQGDLRVQHISNMDQHCKIFTKPLPTPRFLFLRSKLQMDKNMEDVDKRVEWLHCESHFAGDIFGEPQKTARIGDEYQAQIPSLMTKI